MEFQKEFYEAKKWVLKRRPNAKKGLKTNDILLESCTITPSKDLKPDEAVVKVEMLSVDAFVRTTLDTGAYHTSVELGSSLPALGYGVVVAVPDPKSSPFKIGQKLSGMMGAADYAVVRKESTGPFLRLPKVPERAGLHLLGLTTGLTAFVGVNLVLKAPRKGEIVVVSAAAGAVGSIAAQLARNRGAKVIGIAGGSKKVQYLKEELNLFGAVDYKDKSKPVSEQLDELLDGKKVDFFYDNVGGDILDIVLERIAEKGRVVICGAISQYDSGNVNTPRAVQGPSNYLKLAERGATMAGFNVMQKLVWLPYILLRMWIMILLGQLCINEHIVEGGIDSFGQSVIDLLGGANIGKMMIPIAQKDVSSKTEAPSS